MSAGEVVNRLITHRRRPRRRPGRDEPYGFGAGRPGRRADRRGARRWRATRWTPTPPPGVGRLRRRAGAGRGGRPAPAAAAAGRGRRPRPTPAAGRAPPAPSTAGAAAPPRGLLGGCWRASPRRWSPAAALRPPRRRLAAAADPAPITRWTARRPTSRSGGRAGSGALAGAGARRCGSGPASATGAASSAVTAKPVVPVVGGRREDDAEHLAVRRRPAGRPSCRCAPAPGSCRPRGSRRRSRRCPGR